MKRPGVLMIQGTGSGVGKSVIVAALCRIFRNRGCRTAPFKAQNMALNAAVTADGGEIGRSTALQARAAGVEPTVWMNPILLKPKEDAVAQMILHGKPDRDVTAWEAYREDPSLKRRKQEAIREGWERLSREYEMIVIEGAGSPAEVNLRPWDVVNMAVAEMTNAPVLLAADIDRGGALAAIVGTLELLLPEERERVRGFLINKFRGDRRILDPGLAFLEEKTGRPVAGVIPFRPGLDLEEEDALPAEVLGDLRGEVDIAVIHLPHLANFTDFNPLAVEPGVRVRYVRSPDRTGEPDLLILPGTKNTLDDLFFLRESGWADRVRSWAAANRPLMGVCGGFQMLGERLCDPLGVEAGRGSGSGEWQGLGLLPVETRYHPEKVTRRVRACPRIPGFFFHEERQPLEGYEIHCGRTIPLEGGVPLFHLTDLAGNDLGSDGAMSADGRILGTHLHDLFTDDRFRRDLINRLRGEKGIPPLSSPRVVWGDRLETALDRWTDWVEAHLDMDRIEKLVLSG